MSSQTPTLEQLWQSLGLDSLPHDAGSAGGSRLDPGARLGPGDAAPGGRSTADADHRARRSAAHLAHARPATRGEAGPAPRSGGDRAARRRRHGPGAARPPGLAGPRRGGEGAARQRLARHRQRARLRGEDHRRAGAPRRHPRLLAGQRRRGPPRAGDEARRRRVVEHAHAPRRGSRVEPHRQRRRRSHRRRTSSCCARSATPSPSRTARACSTATSSPSNVLIGEFGEVYVADWGIAIRKPKPGEVRKPSLVGSPVYMAPEMVHRRRRADGRAHRRLPARRDALRAAHRQPAVVRARSRARCWRPRGSASRSRRPPRRPQELVAICGKAMAVDPNDRYQPRRSSSARRWAASCATAARCSWRRAAEEPAADAAGDAAEHRAREGVPAALGVPLRLHPGAARVARQRRGPRRPCRGASRRRRATRSRRATSPRRAR